MKIRLPVRKPGPPLKRPPQLKLKASVARSRRAPIVEEEDFLEEPEPNMRLSHAFVVVLVLHVIAVAGVFAFNSIKTKQAEIFSPIKDEPAKTAVAPADATSDSVTARAGLPAEAPADASDPSNGPSLAQPPALSKPVAIASASAVTAPTAAKTHELQSGETLTKVASTYGVTVAELQKVNNITDPTKIRDGTVLTIPAATSAPAPAKSQAIAVASTTKPALTTSAKSAATGTAKDSGKIYVVVKGDNPVKIAKHLKVSYADLLALNGNFNPTRLQIGQKLKIPTSAK